VRVGETGKGVEQAVGRGHGTKERGMDPVLPTELAPTIYIYILMDCSVLHSYLHDLSTGTHRECTLDGIPNFPCGIAANNLCVYTIRKR
jgi:hypothetical protein